MAAGVACVVGFGGTTASAEPGLPSPRCQPLPPSRRHSPSRSAAMEHLESQLGAADVTLTSDVLDRIDQIVPPGVTLLRADDGYVPPALSQPAATVTARHSTRAPSAELIHSRHHRHRIGRAGSS